MEYLEANFDWLEERLQELGRDVYLLFDLPGQVELSTNHDSVKHIMQKLVRLGYRVSVVCRCHALHTDDGVAGSSASLRCALHHRFFQVHLGPSTFLTSNAPP